ncbi:lysylphosphatidylglycerol synthase domain-containing protein [Aequorivita marisscotiae]|uniref:Lysylphosphatidylglycerol synthase TM region n=1 Tax=Aequorivita marisscotiae TaxID=3040348 RepID=A0ABY8KZ28_9FLAO|nr:lysylphosphatidylglycerol synthase domain-containing protein [Aequorivita sp. Ant34-E75]WGF93172.1 hypothetical protein QCQ61_03060 [Aequorivita sp. Ant34-E75]
MIAQSHKAKQYLLATAKVLVLTITFGYIYYKLKNYSSVDLEAFTSSVFSKGMVSGYLFLLFLILAAANWYFEIAKWQNLLSTVEKINFKTALKQSLAALTISLATPNRIGDYGAKALFFDVKLRKKILLLNFFSGTAQMFVTTIFGVFGLLYLLQNFNITYSITTVAIALVSVILIFVLGYFFKDKVLLFKDLSVARVFRFYYKLPRQVKLKTILFSVFRYVIFSVMFYALLLFFGGNISVSAALPLIFAMYFLVSVLPSIFFLDVVIRGGVAVWLFSLVGVSELTVLWSVLAMWLLNFVIPSILGSFFVFTYQPVTR